MMLKFIYKYKWCLTVGMFLFGLSFIIIDEKYFSMQYGSPQQWCVSFFCVTVFLLFHSVEVKSDEQAEEEKEEESIAVCQAHFDYNKLDTKHDYNANADKCCQELDKAFFSFECSSDFDSFLNGLQNKINAYREMRKNQQSNGN